MVVFKILNKVSGQHYVGSCRGDIFERWQLYLQAAENGLDFPLYQEIRELGEAQFAIEEVDYAEAISELKEMELLHTIELNARSLRNYKFGLNDNVVKRRRQIQHENAWKKEIPELSQATTGPATTGTKPVIKPSAAKPSATKLADIRPKIIKPVSETLTTPAHKTTPVAKAPTPRITVKSNPVNPPPNSQITAADTSAELDESLFAESIGMLVRTLNSVEQLNAQQLQAKSQTVALSQALAASDQALQRLQQQQDEAAVKALAAMAAVESSQQANQALLTAHQQAQTCSTAALQALELSDTTAAETQQLQLQLTALLARLKPGSSKPRRAQASIEVARSAHSTTPDTAASSTETVASTAPISNDNNADQTTEQQLVIDQEAKMVNQLKQLDQLLDSQQDQQASPAAGDTQTPAFQASSTQPTRAWIAGTEPATDTDPARANETAAPTVIHRRSRTATRSGAIQTRTIQKAAADSSRSTISRKRLSMKAQ